VNLTEAVNGLRYIDIVAMLIDGLRIKTVTQVNFTVEITPTKFGPVLDMNLWCDCLKIE
jgi:hypothetical protein